MDPLLIEQTSRYLQYLVPEFRDEIPLKMHNLHDLAADGTPRLTGEFSDWLYRGAQRRRQDESPTDATLRLKRAMRVLRGVAPREHDVMWRTLRGESVESTLAWLNDRAERGGHPERYTTKDVIVLIASGTDKLALWY